MFRSEKPRAAQRLADVLHHPARDHEQVQLHERDLAPVALQHQRAREEPRVLAAGHAVGARPAAEVVAGLRRDVGLADTRAQARGLGASPERGRPPRRPRGRMSLFTSAEPSPATPTRTARAPLKGSRSRSVADHEAVGLRQGGAAADRHVPADEAGLDPVLEVADRRAGEHDRVLQLRAVDRHVLADGRVGPDVGVADVRSGADHGRPADGGALELRAGLDRHAALHPRVDQLAVVALLDVVEDQAVGLQHVRHLAGVLPPAVHDVGVDAAAAVHQRLDRVGDLELAAVGRLDRARGVEDRRREHVDAHEREVGGGLGRLLHQPRDAAVGELGHAVVLGVGHGGQQDLRVGRLLAELADQLGDAVAQQVVAEVHHEGRVAEELLGGQHRVGQARAARPARCR